MNPVSNSPSVVPFIELIDLASESVGGSVLSANDEFFAEKENLLKVEAPVFIVGKYTDRGKWMDGWETRRKRNSKPGDPDWCVIKLGIPGSITGVNVDTAHFTGNFPEYCSLEACAAANDSSLDGWKEILPKSRLQGGSSNLFAIASTERFTHLRLRIFPDGGVARLRVHGVAKPDWSALKGDVDLAAARNGGVVVACNDMFFGPKDNLILPGRAAHMGEGWETRRKRGPGHDWIIICLGKAGSIRKIEVDTNHFKGNFPESCSIEGCVAGEGGAPLLAADFRDRADLKWEEILPRTKLQAHHQHYFEKELRAGSAAFDHVRLNIYPDGGISRLRVHGAPK